jgi:hypothetical protein
MGLVVVMFGVTGTGFNLAKRMTNDGKVRAPRGCKGQRAGSVGSRGRGWASYAGAPGRRIAGGAAQLAGRACRPQP